MASSQIRLAVIGGDGIGPEVVAEALKVLKAAGLSLEQVEELRDVSGYTDRPDDFADLIRMLDTELRLITPVDPEGSIDEEVPLPSVGGHYYSILGK